MIRAALPFTLIALISLGACDRDDGEGDDESVAVPECIEYTLDGCALLYPATYDQVWTQTFASGCAEAGTACHAQDDAAGAENGLTFVDPQLSWDHLLTSEAGPDGLLIVAGDPLCSPLFVRLATDDPAIRMPPGSSGISDAALCSIGTWISDGATYVQP